MLLPVIRQKKSVFVAIVLGLCAGESVARPQFGQVIEGEAVISQDKKITQIIQDSQSASIEWANFSLNEGEVCEFFVPDPTSHTFNQVIGTQFSDISGKIKSNGLVTLVNPAGIVYREGSSIDVAGLLSASLNVEKLGSDVYKFSGNQGSIITHGDIYARGNVFFVAPFIMDEGTVHGEGNVVYAGATQATVSMRNGNVLIESESILNPTFVRKSGTVSGGTVLIDAHQRKGEPSSIINIDGLVQAKDITITADHIVLNGSTKLDASVETGQAGRIRVGGDYKGKGELLTARTVTFEPGAVIVADALSEGHGGRIILWSDVASNLHGYVSARGGDKSGDGGFVEASSKSLLYTAALNVSTEAPNGEMGIYLMDPSDFKIQDVTDPNDPNQQSLSELREALLRSNVVIRTSEGEGKGDITFIGPIAWASKNTLTLEAGRHIDLSEGVLDEITRNKIILKPGADGVIYHPDASVD